MKRRQPKAAAIYGEEHMVLWYWLTFLLMPMFIASLVFWNENHAIRTVYNQYTMAAQSAALGAANDVLREVTYDSQGNGTIQYVIDQANGTTDGLNMFVSNMSRLNLGTQLVVDSTTITYPSPNEAIVISHAEYTPTGLVATLQGLYKGQANATIPMTVRGVAIIHPNVTGGQ